MNKALHALISKIIFPVLFFLITQFSNAQTVIVNTTGAGTFVVPCGVTSITVRAWGAGGAGGGSTVNSDSGDGGGSGGYTSGVFTVTSGQTINYIVGAGGTGSINNGVNGGNTTIAGLGLAANGGIGGNSNGGSFSGLGGTASGGTVNTSGANGGVGGSNTGGTGGAAPNGGTGGAGGNDNNGSDGVAPGGGGGGGERSNGFFGSNVGGNGGNGRIEITYAYYCVPTFNNVVEPITNVTVAGINRTTSNTLNGTPALESFCDVATVTQGVVYPISVKGNTDGNFSNYITVYVDWDQNGVFGNNLNERYDIGIIENSNGNNTSTALVGNINVPAGALAGNTRMRVIKSFNNGTNSYVLPCSSNGWGQSEDYAVTVLSACVLPGNTITTASAVCANTPFTLSLQNTSAAAVAYQWQTSPDNATWNNVPSVPFFNTDFTLLPANSNVYGTATVTGGELVLTSAVSSQYGGYVIQATPGSNINSFTTTFDYRMFDGGGADGMSLSYGSDIGNGQGGGEEGEGTGLIIKFDSYDNAGNTTGSQIRISYGGVQIFSNVLNSFNLRNTVYRNVLLSADENGFLSLRIGTATIVSGLALPGGYLSSNKSNWKFKFSARTGGINDKHSIDNLRITYLNSRFTTSQTASTYYRSIVTCGGNTSISTPVLVTIDPVNPKIQTIVHPDCVSARGSVTLNSLPSTGTWTLTRSGTSSATTTGTGSSTTISGLAPGTYIFTVSNGTCTSLASDNVVINSIVTNTWNGTVWSTGLVPTSVQKIVFAGNFNQDVDVVGCSCIVTGSAAVTIKSNRTLTITNEVEVVGVGNLTFENRASLVQINDAAVNAGNIIYKRLTNTGVRNTDYTYWSSPVSPLNLGGTGGISYNPSSLVGSIFYSYEVTAGSEDWKSESATSPMIVGKGYSIRGPGPISVSPLTPLEATFTGKPNNGRYPITGIYPFKSYLIGNPYPSALDADKFLTDNAGVIDGTLYFWTHSTKIGIGVVNPGTGVYAYSGDDYASYNLTGGVGTDGVPYPQGGVEAPSGPGFKPTGKIGAGQGFFATSNTTILGINEIVFNNSMRVGVGGITGNNSQFFKTNSTKLKTTSTIEKNRVWLNLTNTQGAFKQLLVGYITGATNDYDNGYDGETFDGNEFIDFYSVNQEKNFVIQGRALPFDVNDEVSLGYRSVAVGDFSIGIDEVDGIMQSQKVYIEDKLLNVVRDLKASPYDFTTQAGTFNDRFVLRYIDKTLGTGDFETMDNQIVISVKNKQIKIDSPNETIDKVLIFDLIGKQLYKKINVGNNEHVISNLSSSEQVLIVKIVLQNGQTVSKKVIF
ncbi:T9SS sorting signal type C domain-containing protein [Flavobacterium sp. LB2P84]|uniref:T9SS sorting signal type C domain-containing protein n=1 Tax=Flavobacterium yafengii TaxID=3041253 RepID=UPI0024A91000|nr:T9SS sorting signal type C domain-containing protein [Flavobacterium yafengii]MDI6032634.1 T9SS sorting signal type C domain-containing protein [Flavobacterium yafengii]